MHSTQAPARDGRATPLMKHLRAAGTPEGRYEGRAQYGRVHATGPSGGMSTQAQRAHEAGEARQQRTHQAGMPRQLITRTPRG